MTIQVLHERDCSNREIARKLDIDERAVRYRLRRLRDGAKDGRSEKPFRADEFSAVIDRWMQDHQGTGTNLAVLSSASASSYASVGRRMFSSRVGGSSKGIPLQFR